MRMTKRLFLPSHNNVETYLKQVDGILVGVEDMSVNVPLLLKMEEVTPFVQCVNAAQKEIFIALNKNFEEKDLVSLQEILCQLDSLEITGILFYDVALVTLHKELRLKTPLVWGQEHAGTNYATCNFWYDNGIPYGLLSAEITLKEIKQIKEHTNMKLMVPIFGYLSMFVSKRPFITNYTKHFGLLKKGGHYTLEKEGGSYPIVETKEGTTIYSGRILLGTKEYLELMEAEIDYVLINSFLIPEDEMKKVLEIYQTPTAENLDRLERLFPNSEKGFLYKETVYKVKKYD